MVNLAQPFAQIEPAIIGGQQVNDRLVDQRLVKRSNRPDQS